MGILDYLLGALSPEEKKELAKEAAKNVAKGAVKGVGDRVYEKADEVRQGFERAAAARREAEERAREAQERAREAQERERAKVRDAQAIEDELAALKRRVKDGR